MDWVPLVAFVPVQSPAAVHDVAFAALQLSVDELPCTTAVGVAVTTSVGGGFEAVTFTVTDCATVPPPPVQVSVYVVVVKGDCSAEPPVVWPPLHPPEAVQLDAFDVDQLSVVAPPLATVDGAAARDTEGGGVTVTGTTVTLTDCVADPPVPVHVSAKDASETSGPVEDVPDVDLAPLQLPAAVQPVALVEDHASVAALPAFTVDGDTVRVTVGAAGIEGDCGTLAVTVVPAAPPVPMHVSVKAVVAPSAPVGSVPASAFWPLHPPEATQDDEFDDVQSRLACEF